MTYCPHCGHELPKALTPEELRIASLMGTGYGATGIAEETRKNLGTIKNHLSSVYRKLGVPHADYSTRTKLAVWWNCELFQIGLQELGLVGQKAA